jgi:membrane-associated phospholipid phosphatase
MIETATSAGWSARRLYGAAAAFALLTVVAFFLDLAVAKRVAQGIIGGDVARILTWSEVFAHGFGVALIGVVAWTLDPPRRWFLPRALASAYLAGLLANVAKLLVARVRPRFFDLHASVFGSFVGWLPLVNGAPAGFRWGFSIQSFPSGHAATAVGLAIGLAQIYPRGRVLFAVFAALAAVQRIAAGAHFLSDTLGAAAVGLLAAAWVVDRRVLGKWFDKLETRATPRASAEKHEAKR